MSQCKIHNVRFYDPEPKAIKCMILQASSKQLALSRSDASIEIWNIAHTWFLERSISPSVANFSIEGLAWYRNRLFSTGLHGLLLEYNLYKLAIEKKVVVTGDAAYCLDINEKKSLIAVGTDQGYLNVFTISEDEILFEKFFDKQEGKILCLKFDSSGEFVVSGGIDALRIWNVQSGHALYKMTTGRSETNKPTIVWCLQITNDFTIISGDSRGKLSFWDGKVGSQIESYQSHKADILAVCLADNQNLLYCAGVDPTIVNYQKITLKGEKQKWVKSFQRKIHEHDVNGLVLCDNKLYSGGADSYLVCSYHPPKVLLKLPPLLQNPCTYLASSAKYIMLRYSHHIEIWNLSKTENAKNNYRGFLSISEPPKKLLSLQRVVNDDDGEEAKEGIICSCISNDGKWIFYSTHQGNRLFQFSYDGQKCNLEKVEDLEHQDIPCLQAVFSDNNLNLVTAPNTGGLFIYELQNGSASLTSKIETKELTDCITYLLISSDGKYLIAGDPSSNIVIWTVHGKAKQWKSYCKLPKYDCPPTAMAVHPTTLNMIVAYSDYRIVEYNIKRQQFTPFSRGFNKSEWTSKSYPIKSITFDPRTNHTVILQDDSNIIVINKDKKSGEPKTKNRKLVHLNSSSESIKEKSSDHKISYIRKYKHLVSLNWLNEDEMVAVEVNPLGLIEQLPPAFVQKTFGKK